MNAMTTLRPENPADLGYPPMLPIEIALRTAPLKDICEVYGIDQDGWDRLRADPVFIQDLKRCVEDLRTEGVSFKMKARLQAESLLKRSWQMIHAPVDQVPPSVAADLIKFTIRAAGLDGSKDQVAGAAINSALQININLA